MNASARAISSFPLTLSFSFTLVVDMQSSPQLPAMSAVSRRRGMATSLRIKAPAQAQQIALAVGDEDPSTLSSADSDYPPFHTKSDRSSRKNMKKLSLSLPSAQSSSASLQLPQDLPTVLSPERPRRPSIASLPTINPTASLLHRKDEDGGSPSVPYADGPVQVIPGIWIGSEDNARDWKGLLERGIRSVLNVAKEVASPFDSAPASQGLRPAMSTPNFRDHRHPDPTYYPAHVPSGRPTMHYLKLQWSHGQQDLVKDGFKAGMAFADAALERGDGCLIHCQCGISRSATMVIALVMRAAAERHTSVPPEVWALQGMQGAYSFVKEKSPCVGPNMSLIYQLLEYEKNLRGEKGSPPPDSDGSSGTDEEEEWGRRRRMMDETSDQEADERESSLVMQEAHALDKAMEDRIVARKSSISSMSSTGSGSGIGMGVAWRNRYGSRKRTGSISSSNTNGSFLSEDLVEEDEEQELLGVGGNFDNDSHREEGSSLTSSPDDEQHDGTPRNISAIQPSLAVARPPPSAPVWKTSFTVSPPPMTAIRSTFELPAQPPTKPKASKRRPLSLCILPPVPSSPVNLVIESDVPASIEPRATSKPGLPLLPIRQRAESRKLVPPPLHLRNSVLRKMSNSSTELASMVTTPSQTLFVFPPSPTLTTRTPSTMTLTSNIAGPVPFPSLLTPRVSTFHSQGRTRSFIGLRSPPTPTVAFSKVDVRGYIGLE